MVNKHRYYCRSRIAEKVLRQWIPFFLDLSAPDTARLAGINVRSVNSIYIKLRQCLAEECEHHSPLSGQIEVDESDFGPKRIRGKQGRGASSKTMLFGLFKRHDLDSAEMLPDVRKLRL